ncbi:hypothetical protein FRC0360_00167 [Corynebacterium diphtheriae]|nr:hypothetical protein FRC0360_00167 [Corynebacterium diphtheriae]
MRLFMGKNVNSVFFGKKEIKKIYYGGDLVWEKPPNIVYTRIVVRSNGSYLQGHIVEQVGRPLLFDFDDFANFIQPSEDLKSDKDFYGPTTHAAAGERLTSDNRYFFKGEEDYILVPYDQEWGRIPRYFAKAEYKLKKYLGETQWVLIEDISQIIHNNGISLLVKKDCSANQNIVVGGFYYPAGSTIRMGAIIRADENRGIDSIVFTEV